MRFSIVIPTYNNLSELKGCLHALTQLKTQDFEVLLGIDGSQDGTTEWLSTATFPYPLQVLHHPGHQNQGRAATRNLALPHLRGTYTLFLDSDMAAQPDLLDAHQAILDQGNTISIGAVHYHNAQDNIWVRYTSQRGVAKYPHGAQVPFHYFITPNTALPTTYFKSLHGFDPLISRYGGEDMELGYRIHLQFDPKYIYNAQAIVSTTQPKTLRQALSQLREYGATGLPYITRKWPALSNIYWVNKCHSTHLQDRLFTLLTRQPFRALAHALLILPIFPLQKLLISYLVISHVHQGYRTQQY